MYSVSSMYVVCVCVYIVYAGTVEQARAAIGHLTRVIRARSNLLNKPNKFRRVPR